MRIMVAGAFCADSTKAHALNTVKMAHGFSKLGHEVTLVCRRPASGTVSACELLGRFGIGEKIRVRQLSYLCGEHWLFALACLPELLTWRPSLVYARNYNLPWLSSRLGIATAAESHAHPDNRSRAFFRLVNATQHSTFRLWVTISSFLAAHYRSLGVPSEKLAVQPDAVDLELFARPSFLPPTPYQTGAPNVVYAGHLYDYKGIPTLLHAAQTLPQVNFQLVGGLPADLASQRQVAAELGLENVFFHGHVPHGELPPFLWHADALLLPPSANHPSAQWTSPMKLGEYLAAGVPVISSDIPALRALLDDSETRFFRPDNPAALAAAIEQVLKDERFSRELVRHGLEKVREFSYEYRAGSILQKILEAGAGDPQDAI